MKIFLVPVTATFALLFFWLYALTHYVYLGDTAHGAGGQSNAAWFNVVLLILLALLWIGALVVHTTRDKWSKKGKVSK